MKKFWRITRKLVSYGFLYVFCTLAAAVGVIFISSNASGSGGSNEEGGITVAPQLTHIFENFSTVKAMQINLDASIETEVDTYNIALNTIMDMSGGFESLRLDGTLTAFINGSAIDMQFRYGEGSIYFDIMNGKYKIQTNNIMESIGGLLSILNVEIPEIGGLDLGNLDFNMILAMLSDLTETKNENTITLKINVPVIGSLEMVCDLNYSVQEITLPKTSIDKTTFSLNTNIAYPESVDVILPSEPEYIEVTDLFTIAESLLSYMNQETIGFNLDVKYNDIALQGSLSANLKDMSAVFSLNVLDKNLNITAIDNVIYLDYGNIFVKYALEDSILITNLLKEQFNIDIPLDQVTTLLASLKNGNFMDVIPGIDLNTGDMDLSNIDLSVLEKIERVGDDYLIQLRDIGTIHLTITNKALKSIQFVGMGADAKLETITPKEIGLANLPENYIDLKAIVPTIDSAINTLKYDNFTGLATIQIQDNVITAEYALTKENNALSVYAKINAFGQTFEIVLAGQELYLTYSDLHIKASLNHLSPVFDFLEKQFNIIIPEFSTDTLIKMIQNMLDPAVNPALITTLQQVDNGLIIGMYNGLQLSLTSDGTILKELSVTMDNLQVTATVLPSQTAAPIPNIDESKFTSIETVIAMANATIDYVNAKEYYVNFSLTYQDILVNGSLNYDTTLSAYLFTKIDGVSITVQLKDGIIYAQLDDLKLCFDLRDINIMMDFVRERFGVDLALKLEELKDKLTSTDTNGMLKNLYIGYADNMLSVNVSGATVNVQFDNNLPSSATINYQDIALHATIEKTPSSIDVTGTYFNISETLPFLNMVMDYVETKQYNLIANAQVYNGDSMRFDAKANLQIDLTNKLQLYANAAVTGEQKINLLAHIYQDKLYVDYNDLLLSINTFDLEELMVIALNMLGIDPGILPFLQDIANGMDLDMNSIAHLLPSLDMSNPLSMIGIIRDLSVQGNVLNLTLNGNLISANPNAQDMFIRLETDGTKLTNLKILNLYTGVSTDEFFNLDISFSDFNGVTTPDTTQNYVDISGANELIKAIINTAELTDFEVQGSLKIKMNVIGIDIDWSVPLNVKVKVVDKKPEILATIGAIPVIPGVNDDAPYKFGNTVSGIYAGLNRMLTVYYKDDYVYFYRTEQVPVFASSARTYEKKLKVHYETVMADPMAYLQYGIGFSDAIMEQISKAMSTASNRENPIDLGNIIKTFHVDSNDTYTVKLNLAELANNKDLDSITITMKTINNEQTNHKNYLGNMTLDLYMPIASAFTLNLQSNDLALVNIGQIFDFTSMYQYVNSYGYVEDAKWDAYNGDWSLSSAKTYTITFESNGGDPVPNITANATSPIEIPSFTTRVVDDQANNIEYTYTFRGWYTTSDFQSGTLFTATTMPRRDTALYAKWELTNTNVYGPFTITFETNGGPAVEPIISRAYASITIPTFTERTFDDTENFTLYTYAFRGWYTTSTFQAGSEFTATTMPRENITLYARWELISTVKYGPYTITFVTYTNSAFETVVAGENDQINLTDYTPTKDTVYVDKGYNWGGANMGKWTYEVTRYTFEGWYLDESFTTRFTGLMPNKNITLYANYTSATTTEYLYNWERP